VDSKQHLYHIQCEKTTISLKLCTTVWSAILTQKQTDTQNAYNSITLRIRQSQLACIHFHQDVKRECSLKSLEIMQPLSCSPLAPPCQCTEYQNIKYTLQPL